MDIEGKRIMIRATLKYAEDQPDFMKKKLEFDQKLLHIQQ